MNGAVFGNSIFPFIRPERRKGYLYLIIFGLCMQIGGFSLLFFDVPLFKISIALILLPVIPVILSSVESFFLFIVIYSTCFHLDAYHRLFRGMISVKLTWENLYALYALFLIYWIVSLIMRKKRMRISLLGWSIIIYVGLAIFSFMHGLFNGYYSSMNFLRRSEIFPQLMYLCFFVFLTTRLRNMDRKVLFDLILFASAFIGLQLIYAFSKNNLASFTRINTITVQISCFAFPYVLSIIYFTQKSRRKIIAVITLLPISFGVLISLQRSLWLAIFVIFVVSLLIYFYKRGFSLAKIVGVAILGIIGFLFAFIIAVLGLSRITSGAAILVLIKRLISLANFQYLQVDASGFVRMTEIKQALASIHGIQWIYGRGIGDTFYSFLRTTTKPYLDNSYAWVLWKMGIIGLLSFMSMFAIFFQRAIFLLKKCANKRDLIYIVTITMNMLGIMICSLGNASLIQFRYIIIWSTSMGVIETMYREYRYGNTAHVLK